MPIHLLLIVLLVGLPLASSPAQAAGASGAKGAKGKPLAKRKPGDIAQPIPAPRRAPFAWPAPAPKKLLMRELNRLDGLLDKLMIQDQKYQQALIAPTLTFGAGAMSLILGVAIVALVHPAVVAPGAPPEFAWLGLGAGCTVVGFAVLLAASFWYTPIARKRKPIRDVLDERKDQRAALVQEMLRAGL